MADYIRPVVFTLGGQKFGVDINLVQSIERQVDVVPVPNAMEDRTKGNNTVIVNLPDMKIALEVDEVLEIGELNAEKIVDMPRLAKNEETEYLDRVASVDGDLVILLDINKILSEDEAQGVREFAEQMSRND